MVPIIFLTLAAISLGSSFRMRTALLMTLLVNAAYWSYAVSASPITISDYPWIGVVILTAGQLLIATWAAKVSTERMVRRSRHFKVREIKSGLKASASAEIKASASQVFRYLVEPHLTQFWRIGLIAMEREDEGPMREGSRSRIHLRIAGRNLVTESVILEIEPDRLLVEQEESNLHRGKREIRLQEVDSVCRVELEDLISYKGFNKFSEPFLRLHHGRWEREHAEGNLRRLKAAVEEPGIPLKKVSFTPTIFIITAWQALVFGIVMFAFGALGRIIF